MTTEYIQVTHRELPYETFDADNHLYENQDALTKFLPPEYEGVDQVRRRSTAAPSSRSATRSATTSRTRRSRKVAVPGGCGHDVTKGGGGIGDTRRRLHRHEAGRDARHRRLLRPRAAPRSS